MKDTERQDTEGEAGSTQGARRGTRSRLSRTTPWAEGGAKLLSHPGIPLLRRFLRKATPSSPWQCWGDQAHGAAERGVSDGAGENGSCFLSCVVLLEAKLRQERPGLSSRRGSNTAASSALLHTTGQCSLPSNSNQTGE